MKKMKIVILILIILIPTYALAQDKLPDLKEVVIIAPDPPSIEMGYYGLLPDKPFGIHLSYSTTSFKSYLNFATDEIERNFYAFEVGPKKIGKSKYNDLLNPYFKGLVDQNHNHLDSRLLLSNRFYLFDNFGLDAGFGSRIRKNSDPDLVYLLGLKK